MTPSSSRKAGDDLAPGSGRRARLGMTTRNPLPADSSTLSTLATSRLSSRLSDSDYRLFLILSPHLSQRVAHSPLSRTRNTLRRAGIVLSVPAAVFLSLSSAVPRDLFVARSGRSARAAIGAVRHLRSPRDRCPTRFVDPTISAVRSSPRKRTRSRQSHAVKSTLDCVICRPVRQSAEIFVRLA